MSTNWTLYTKNHKIYIYLCPKNKNMLKYVLKKLETFKMTCLYTKGTYRYISASTPNNMENAMANHVLSIYFCIQFEK